MGWLDNLYDSILMKMVIRITMKPKSVIHIVNMNRLVEGSHQVGQAMMIL